MLMDTINEMFGETIRVVVVVDMVALIMLGVFIVDYHRKETPNNVLAVLWSYMLALAGGAIAVMANVVYGPPPTLGVYVFGLLSSLVVAYLATVAVRSVRSR